MFQEVPPADAVVLKSTLHDWGDDDCLKILKRCRESISQHNKKGKVLIIDVVIGDTSGNGSKEKTELHLSTDIAMMALCSAKERTEKEWAKLFSNAGFSRYEISPIDIGLKSVIQVYP
ncbi:hypothetical protein MLD38_037768 [Melastoma candidum]|uniref:Uncharacterized protein n=1 Tax=Melastoma candidum TaxID=119954 RepID=A0ACB9LNP5_9MYRT|nr:hypothetical protein MLD38_037768 [Melastoma candidum]